MGSGQCQCRRCVIDTPYSVCFSSFITIFTFLLLCQFCILKSLNKRLRVYMVHKSVRNTTAMWLLLQTTQFSQKGFPPSIKVKGFCGGTTEMTGQLEQGIKLSVPQIQCGTLLITLSSKSRLLHSTCIVAV